MLYGHKLDPITNILRQKIFRSSDAYHSGVKFPNWSKKQKNLYFPKWLKSKRKEILNSNSYTIWETTNLKFRKLNLDPHRGHLRSLKVKKVKF